MSDYLKPVAGGGTTNMVNFYGNFSGNVAWDSQQITQGVTTTSDARVGDEIASLISAIKQALPVLELVESEAAALRGQLELVEAELEGDKA